jgi:hypothetical protein
MDLGVTDAGGLTALAELIIPVDPQPAFLEWAAANRLDPDEPGSLKAFVFGGQPGGEGPGWPRLHRSAEGDLRLVVWVPAGAEFEADGPGLAATVEGARIRVECGDDLANWVLPVREVPALEIPDYPSNPGWEIRAFVPDGNPERAFLRFALDFHDE